ncbi:MAG: hypothetical protein JST19_18105 [Bacteroidetes bacterium]|nr:hypothetical protein [Bacteroidota bacterium]
MNIEHKYRILEKIMQSEDDILLNEIDSLLNISNKDFWHDLPNQVKQSINKAKQELDNGEGIPHEQVMAEVRNRYLKK